MCVVVCVYVYVLELNEIILKCSAQCLVYEIHILIFVICMLIMKMVTMKMVMMRLMMMMSWIIKYAHTPISRRLKSS